MPRRPATMIPPLILATGIENGNPTIDGGRKRVDEMAGCGHDRRWRNDFDCVVQLGLKRLRYGSPRHRNGLGPDPRS